MNNPDLDRRYVQPVYFGTEAQAKEFVARAGISRDELVEAHKFPPERITVEELRRRAKADE